MPYTRGQISASIAAAAQSLLSLRFQRTAVVEAVNQNHGYHSTTTAVAMPVAAHTSVTKTPTQKQFWTQWTNWYHAFLAEVNDESPSLPIAERRSQATTRWVTSTSKRLHCSESQVRAWLRTADQKALVAAYA